MLIIEEKDDSEFQRKEETTEEVTKILIESIVVNMINPYSCETREKRLQKETDRILKKRNEIQREK